MHEFNLKMIKGIIVILVTAVVINMVGGISLLRDNYYFRDKYFKLQEDYAKTKLDFAIYEYGGIYQWLTSGGKDAFSNNVSQNKAQSIPVLLYHGVIEDPNWKPDGVNISLSDFQSQMFALKKAGYKTITMADYLDFIQGKKQLDEKSILITFDDARVDSFYPVDPILRTLHYNAVMFVITGRSFGAGNQTNVFHLTNDELKKMVESGRWEMGSHTQNGHGTEKIDANGTQGHFLTSKVWLTSLGRAETDEEYKQRIKQDLANSKQDLEKNLGVKVLGFAYPFGDYGHSDPVLVDIVNSLFPLSFRQTRESEFPRNYTGHNLHLMSRINVSSEMSTDQLLFILNGDSEKTIPFEDNFSENQGWLTGWGNFELKNGLLLTRASESEDSSMTFLNGTYEWKDYSVKAVVRLLKGNSFAAVARYTDGNNYVSCDFSNVGITLSQRVDGQEADIRESREVFVTTPDKDSNIGIDVKGNQATCFVGDRAVATGSISNKLDHGGIGFKTWDNTINNSSLIVYNLKVQ